MMLKTLFVHGAVLALSAVQVAAHAAINPALGVDGTAARSDVERPSNNNPCGRGVDIAAAIDGSTPVQADASGSFTVDVENFNGGRDGSRQVTMRVDAAGDGQNFVDGDVTTNGELAPSDTGTEQVTASLPAGTTCSGGASGNLCVVSFTTAGGFGNCVVVQQGGNDNGGGAAAGGNANNGNNGNGSNGNGNNNNNGNGNNNDDATDDNNANNGNGNNGNGNIDNANGNGNGTANNGNGNNGNRNGNANAGTRNGRNRGFRNRNRLQNSQRRA